MSAMCAPENAEELGSLWGGDPDCTALSVSFKIKSSGTRQSSTWAAPRVRNSAQARAKNVNDQTKPLPTNNASIHYAANCLLWNY